ncbi:IS3 family transposase [Streptomyces sp. LBUM 1481]|nr:IS3 family transposase [Streptomyces sp. LBUM 1481]
MRPAGTAHPSSTYYRWRRAEKEPCERRRRDVELAERIKEIHAESGGNYGSPRVHAVLRREGTRVGRKRVERLMREADIAGISPRRKGFTRRDPKASLAPDLVNRDFTAPAPNRLWVTDSRWSPPARDRCGSPRSGTHSPAGGRVGDLRPRGRRPGPDHAGVRARVPRGRAGQAHPPRRPRLSVHVHQAHNPADAGGS